MLDLPPKAPRFNQIEIEAFVLVASAAEGVRVRYALLLARNRSE